MKITAFTVIIRCWLLVICYWFFVNEEIFGLDTMAEIKKTKPPRINKDEPIANLIPVDEIHLHLKNAKGWL